MKLEPVKPRGRRFPIQFFEIMREFGDTIPWLRGLNELKYATDGEYFHDELMRKTKQNGAPIVPYQLTDSDDAHTYLGGIIYFPKSPETLTDPHNLETAERLADEGASFISCLQVRDVKRGTGNGRVIMERALRAIRHKHGSVWGVVSDQRLINWYKSLGAEILSPPENKDQLWIVHWNDNRTT